MSKKKDEKRDREREKRSRRRRKQWVSSAAFQLQFSINDVAFPAAPWLLLMPRILRAPSTMRSDSALTDWVSVSTARDVYKLV